MENSQVNRELFDYIASSPTPFQAVAHTSGILSDAGYTLLKESDPWQLEPGRGYYTVRNASSIIAFRIPEGEFDGFMITASHCDSPCLKIKENAEQRDDHYVRLSVEPYGGMIMSTWLDRPLSIAGRVLVRTEQGFAMRLVDLKEPVCVIPNVAIHMNRKANEGYAFDASKDMLPLYDLSGGNTLRALIAKAAGAEEKDLLTTDLFVYNPQPGCAWNKCISAPRLDDLQCAFSALKAFLSAEKAKNLPVLCIFDNEEVGSTTKQGAAGTFLSDVLERIAERLGLGTGEYRRKIASGFMVSCDNAHAVHPNHPEFRDPNHSVYLNGGPVIKYNAAQRYTSDAVSAAVFGLICERAGVPFQRYANRADLRGGGTLGNIANTQISLDTVDIGIAQLAMHSSYETAGDADTLLMIRALTAFYTVSLCKDGSGTCTIV